MSDILFVAGDKSVAQSLIKTKEAELTRRQIKAIPLDLSQANPTEFILQELSEMPKVRHRVAFLGIQPSSDFGKIPDWSLKEIISLLRNDAFKEITKLINPSIFLGSTKISSNLAAHAETIIADSMEHHQSIDLDDPPGDLEEELISLHRALQSQSTSTGGPVIFDVKDPKNDFVNFLDSAFRLASAANSSASAKISSAAEIKNMPTPIGVKEFIYSKNDRAKESMLGLLRAAGVETGYTRLCNLTKLSLQILKDASRNQRLITSFPSQEGSGLADELAGLDGFKILLSIQDGEVVGAVMYAKFFDLINENLNQVKAQNKDQKPVTDDKSSFFKRYLRQVLNKMCSDGQFIPDSESLIVVDLACNRDAKGQVVKALKSLQDQADLYYLVTEGSKGINEAEELASHAESGLKLFK